MAVPAAMMLMGSSVCVNAPYHDECVVAVRHIFRQVFSSGQCMDDEGPVADAFASRQYGLCRRCGGAVSLICMFCLKCGLYRHKSRNLFGEFKNNFYFCTPKQDVAQSG